MVEAKGKQSNARLDFNDDSPSVVAGIASYEKLSRILPTAVFLIVVGAFLPTLLNGFVDWQDETYLVNNTQYRGFGWAQLLWMISNAKSGVFQPLTWLSFASDYRLWILDPFGYHLTSLLIHGANTMVMCVITTQLLSAAGIQRSRLNIPLQWTTAVIILLFALHPMRVEAVALASARNYLLSTLFLLAAFSAYLRSVQNKPNKFYRKWVFVALTAHLLSVLSGANGFVLPILLILTDIYPLKRFENSVGAKVRTDITKALAEKLPYFALGLAGSVAVLCLGSHANFTDEVMNTDLQIRFAQLFYAPVFYLWKTILPIRLIPAYEFPETIQSWQWFIYFGGVIAMSFVIAALYVRSQRSAILIVWSGYLVTVWVPMLSLETEARQFLADRFSYLPVLALAVAIAVSVEIFLRTWNPANLRSLGFGAAGLGALVAVAVLSILTWRQVLVWRDAETLWRNAVSLESQSRWVRHKLADLLIAQNKDSEAVDLYRRATAANTNSALTFADYAQVLVKRGRFVEAQDAYQRALKIDARLALGLFGMGNLLAMQGDFDGAILQYHKALASVPAASSVYTNLGYALARRGQLHEAVMNFRKAVQLDSSNFNAYFNLAGVLATQGKTDEAVKYYREVLKISPGHAKAHHNLASLLNRMGSIEEAITHYQEAINYNPDFAEPYLALGIILANQRRFDRAIEYYRHAIGIKPALAEARQNLARALAAQGKKDESLREYQEAKRILQESLPPTGVR
jgi:protein O-mannosyl-transferase